MLPLESYNLHWIRRRLLSYTGNMNRLNRPSSRRAIRKKQLYVLSGRQYSRDPGFNGANTTLTIRQFQLEDTVRTVLQCVSTLSLSAGTYCIMSMVFLDFEVQNIMTSIKPESTREEQNLDQSSRMYRLNRMIFWAKQRSLKVLRLYVLRAYSLWKK